jgi:hypothetical protein
MPKPTIFSVAIKGQQRLLFSIQERASGDLTIIVKHSRFHTAEDGGASTQNDRVTEERYSIHKSNESPAVNVIKYTKVVANGSLINSNNYTKALKVFNQFAAIVIRRAGDLSDTRYLVPPSKGTIISLGSYNTDICQPVFMVLVGNKDRIFLLKSSTNINVLQRKFSNFNIVVLWQFLALHGEASTKSLNLKTFNDEEIAEMKMLHYAEAEKMAKMSEGVSDIGAIDAFIELRTVLANSLLDSSFSKMSAKEKDENFHMHKTSKELGMYVQNGEMSQELKSLVDQFNIIAEFHRLRGRK